MTSKRSQLLSRKEAADYIGYEVSTLEKWASENLHLDYEIIEGKAYYDVEQLDEFDKRKQTF